MIDIQLLRNDIDTAARRLATRGVTLDVAAFRALGGGWQARESEALAIK